MPSAESDAPKRGHLLTIAKSDDWHEDEPYWDWSVTCVAPDLCGGWQECGETGHAVDGIAATDGPYDSECPGAHGVSTDRAGHLPWCDEDEFEFHGVWHTWRYGNGWTVPYSGCVVQTADIGEYADDIAREHGEGTFVVDDEWDDTSCYLTFVTRVTSPAKPVRDLVTAPSDAVRGDVRKRLAESTGRLEAHGEVAASADERVVAILDEHFIMWRDLEEKEGPPGEWFCSCGAKFGFSYTAIRHVATALAGVIADAKAEALRVTRLVEADMAEAALKAWRSADARRGLSDHDALLTYADALTRWSERFRMAFGGEDYRDDRAARIESEAGR